MFFKNEYKGIVDTPITNIGIKHYFDRMKRFKGKNSRSFPRLIQTKDIDSMKINVFAHVRTRPITLRNMICFSKKGQFSFTYLRKIADKKDRIVVH